MNANELHFRWMTNINKAYKRLHEADSKRVVELIDRLERNGNEPHAKEEIEIIREKEKHYIELMKEIEWQTGNEGRILDPASRRIHEEVGA